MKIKKPKNIKNPLSLQYYANNNPFCEYTYFTTNKKIYENDYIDNDSLFGYKLINKNAKLHIHHIFGKINNNESNLIRIIDDPLHRIAHSHNNGYDKRLKLQFIIIKIIKSEIGILDLRDYGFLSSFNLLIQEYKYLLNEYDSIKDRILNYKKIRINKYNYDIIDSLLKYENEDSNVLEYV